MLGLFATALAIATSPVSASILCEDPQLPARARCQTVMVPEDRSQPRGRQIALNVVVIPAARPQTPPQALFDLEGGPGLAVTKNASFYGSDGTGYAETRDVVLVDQRGTGRSNPLDCPEFDAADRNFEPMFPLSAVNSCRERLSRNADLARYTTDEAAADLEAVRMALGDPKVDLVALSYGTTLALRYIALNQAKVRSAILLSAVPASATPPRHHAQAAQTALDRLMEDCRADRPCNAAYPDLGSDLDEAVRRLRLARQIDPAVAMERLRTKLYSPTGARELPAIIHRLAAGDTAVLATSNERAGFNYFDGVYLTITCAESLPWFDQRSASAEARQTRFGDYRLVRQRVACAAWPRAHISSAFFADFRSSVPTLFISGGRDPVSPASWADQAARRFTNARHLVIPWAGHIVDGLSNLDTCYDTQMIGFLESTDPQAVDSECFGSMQPPPFKVPRETQSALGA